MLSSWKAHNSRSTMYLSVLILLCCCLSTKGFFQSNVVGKDDRVMGLTPKSREAFKKIDNVLEDVYRDGQVNYEQANNIINNLKYIFKHSTSNQSVEVASLVVKDLERGDPRGVFADYLKKLLQDVNKKGIKESELIKLADKTTSLIQAEQDRSFPKQPNFIQSLFGAAPGAKPYSNYETKMQGFFSTSNKVVQGMDQVVNNPKNDVGTLIAGNNTSSGQKAQAAGNIISGAGGLINNIFGNKNNSNTTVGKIANSVNAVGGILSSIAGATDKNKTTSEKAQQFGGTLSTIGNLLKGFSGPNSTNSTSSKFGNAITSLGGFLTAGAGNGSNSTTGNGKTYGQVIGNVISGFEGNNANGSHVGQTVSKVASGISDFASGLASLFQKKKTPTSDQTKKTGPAGSTHDVATTTESGLQKFGDVLGWFG